MQDNRIAPQETAKWSGLMEDIKSLLPMNMNRLRYCKKIYLLVFFLLLPAGIVCAQSNSETAKIEYLITSVGELKGAKFVRNGTEYEAPAAASHLRLKLKTAGRKVKTAEDFIQYCASRSSISGEPYLIRFIDGTTVKSEVFFRNQLKAFPKTNIP